MRINCRCRLSILLFFFVTVLVVVRCSADASVVYRTFVVSSWGWTEKGKGGMNSKWWLLATARIVRLVNNLLLAVSNKEMI